ncbi:karyopherin beta [Gaertneriomyces sp. JEL0708]|nr:karyopherin beta [Gaertneriomyces sp. JEL0708]
MTLAPLLQATLDPVQRESAEAQLASYAEQSFPTYVGMLAQEVASENNGLHIRQAAALALKNALSAKESPRKEELATRWVQTDAQAKSAIKAAVLQTLASTETRAGYFAAQVIQALAEIELPRGEWPELIPAMLDNVTKTDSITLKQASLQALGLICETVDPNTLTQHANAILTAVVSGARKEEPSSDVQIAALSALYNSLEFVRANFDNVGERNYIMQVVCEATRSASLPVQVAAFENLVKIMSLYYAYMDQYMTKALGPLTFWGMKHEEEDIVLQAIEFWSTVCEEEIDIDAEFEQNAEDDVETSRAHHHFSQTAVAELVDALWWLMTKKEEDDDEDEWNVSMAAATCLSLLAAAARDQVVAPVLTFVQQHIQSSDWRYKEASVMAFGSIMDGPNPDLLGPLVIQAMPVLIVMMKESIVQVKDTTAWTLGRICEILPHFIQPEVLPNLIAAILSGLDDTSRVASNCAWALMNLGETLGAAEQDTDSSTLSPFFETAVFALNSAAERPQQDPNFRASAYEAVSTLVAHSAADCLDVVNKLAILILDRLEHTIAMQNQLVSADDRRAHYELQSNLCGVMSSVVRRLASHIVPIADRTMQALLMIMSSASKASTVMEDAFLAVGALTTALKADFARYMGAFTPFLYGALQNHEEHQMCSIAVGLVGDLSRSLGEQILPYCDTLMNILIADLQNPALSKDVKPSILSAFGDIALAIGESFAAYLEIIMAVLQQAGSMASLTMTTSYDYDYGNQLREGIIEAYVGITQGMSTKPNVLANYGPQIFGFAQEVAAAHDRPPSVTAGLAGLIGDLASVLPLGQFKPLFSQDWIMGLLRSVKTDRSLEPDVKVTARWARENVRKHITA